MSLRESLKNRLFWKVYVIWFLRRIFPLVILQILIFALALRIFAKNVFVIKVLRNAAVGSNFNYWQALEFLGNAFVGTKPITQEIVLLILGFGALILRDILRSLFTYWSMRRKR